MAEKKKASENKAAKDWTIKRLNKIVGNRNDDVTISGHYQFCKSIKWKIASSFELLLWYLHIFMKGDINVPDLDHRFPCNYFHNC